MSNSKVTLNEKHWKSLCKTLQGISKQCNDAVINDGVIRQRSNDASAIFEVDMTSMLGSSTFTLSNIKEELKRLKDLTGQVTIEADQNKVVFSDGVSSYNMPAPDKNYLDNKYMSKEDLDSLLRSVSQRTSPLIKHTIEKKNLKRIRNAASTFHANSYKVVFEDNSASITVEGYGGSKDLKPSMDITKNIPLSEPTTGYMRLPISPYGSFDYNGDVGWEIYRGDKAFLSKNYGDIGDLTATTYTRGELKNDERDPAPRTEEIPEEGVEAPEAES